LKNEDWNRFLPQFKKKNVPRKKQKVESKKKPYTPFPPAQPPSKIDLQLESGEYFLSDQQRRRKLLFEKSLQSKLKSKEKKEEREKLFIPPTQDSSSKKKKKKRKHNDDKETNNNDSHDPSSHKKKKHVQFDLESMKRKLEKTSKKNDNNLNDFVDI